MSRRAALLVAVAAALGVHAWLLAIGVNPLRNGGAWDQLWDPDSYTRLSRVLELRETGAWLAPTFRGANFPRGFALHWTRLLDVILLVPSWVASAFAPFPVALQAWGSTLGPVLHVGAILLLAWCTKPFLGTRSFLLLAAFLVTQRGVTYDFLPGIVDHHYVQLFLLLAAMGLLARRSDWLPGAAAAGVAMGLAVWTSAESLVLAGALAAGLGIVWLLDGGLRSAQRLAVFGSSATAASAVFLLVERGLRGLSAVSYDRLSLVQVGALAALAAAAWGLVAASGTKAGGTVQGRVLLAAALACGALCALLLLFPGILDNPYDQYSGAVQTRLLPSIAAERRFLPSDPYSAYDFFLELGPAFVALALGARRLARGGAEPEERQRLLLTGSATVLFVAYAIYAYRGLSFASAACALPWTEQVGGYWSRSVLPALEDGARRAGALARGLLLGGGHWLVAAAIAVLWMPSVAWKNAPDCRWDALVDAVPGLRIAAGSGTVLTDVFSGPEVHYRTGRPVIGSPYHGNGEGVEATLRLFEAPPEATQRELKERDVRWIAICGARRRELEGFMRNPGGLGGRLMMGLPPAGFARVQLPQPLDGQFLLYGPERR